MRVIIFDTSAVNLLNRRSSRWDLLRAVKQSGLELSIPWMVCEELIAHQVLPYIEAFQQATAAINRLNKRNEWGDALRRPSNEIERARSYWRGQYEELFRILETSGEAARQALSREANCQRPAKVDPENKGGARDAAIWLSVMDFLKANPEESVFFVCGNTSDFGDGSSYPEPMADDLRAAGSRLTLLTSFPEFVSRFTEPITVIDTERVQSLLESLLMQTSNPIGVAAANLHFRQPYTWEWYTGTAIGIGNSSTGYEYRPFRWQAWLTPPTATVRHIGEMSGHKIGGEEWYTATVDWILTGYAVPGPQTEILAPPDYRLILMGCQWQTKILFSTRGGESLSIIEYDQPAALEPGDQEEWEPLLNKTMALPATYLARLQRIVNVTDNPLELNDGEPSNEAS
jgi:hypothetical protein